MRTKEFIKNVEKLGFTAEKENTCIFIKNSQRFVVAKIRHDKEKLISTDYLPFYYLAPKFKKKLFELIVKYAATQPKDREEPKKYYLRLKGAEHLVEKDRSFLNLKDSEYFISSKIAISGFKTEFTQEEIDELPKELLEAFDKIEVEDED